MKEYVITSRQNDTFKVFRNLLTSKGIGESGQALISGRKTVPEILRNYPDHCAGLIVSEEMEISKREPVANVYVLSRELFDTLDVFGSKYPILLARTPPIADWQPRHTRKGCRLAIPFQDPSNMGAVLRSAAAFDVEEIILAPGAAHPFHPRSSRAASGTLFLHEYLRVRNLNDLKTKEYPVVALDVSGRDLTRFDFPESFILLPGVEGPGLPAGLVPDFTVSIPMNARVESLNAAVATGIALFAWRTQKKLRP